MLMNECHDYNYRNYSIIVIDKDYVQPILLLLTKIIANEEY